MDIEYLDFFDPLSAQNDTKEEEHADPTAKEHRERRRKFELLSIPDKILYRKAYGVQQFLEVMKFTPPQKGHSIHVITGGHVDMICYLQYLLLHYDHMERVMISTWCLGGSELLMMEEWHKQGKVKVFDMLCGEHCKQQYKVEWAKLMRMQEAGIVDKCECTTNHSKIILIDTGTDKVVVETSSNFNMNPRIEQGCITMSDELHDFYRDYFNDLFNDPSQKFLKKQ